MPEPGNPVRSAAPARVFVQDLQMPDTKFPGRFPQTMKHSLKTIHRQLLHRGRLDTSRLEVAGRAITPPGIFFSRESVPHPLKSVQPVMDSPLGLPDEFNVS